jgi:hypothetical protein
MLLTTENEAIVFLRESAAGFLTRGRGDDDELFETVIGHASAFFSDRAETRSKHDASTRHDCAPLR